MRLNQQEKKECDLVLSHTVTCKKLFKWIQSHFDCSVSLAPVMFLPLLDFKRWHLVGPAVVWGEHDAFELYHYSLMRRPRRQTLTVHPFISAFLKAEHMKSHAGALWVWVSVGAAAQQPWLFRIVCLFSQSLNISGESPDCGRLTDSNVRSAFSIVALTVESFTCARLSFFCGLLLWKSQDSCGHLHVLWQGSGSDPANKRNSNGLILCACTLWNKEYVDTNLGQPFSEWVVYYGICIHSPKKSKYFNNISLIITTHRLITLHLAYSGSLVVFPMIVKKKAFWCDLVLHKFKVDSKIKALIYFFILNAEEKKKHT